MKAKFEMSGFLITIEELEGTITVQAEKDEEVVEEFTLETEEAQGEDTEGNEDDEMKSFDDFGEEDDFDGEKPGHEEETEETEETETSEPEEEKTTLESFQSFINKRK